jgi:hypothetical protein
MKKSKLPQILLALVLTFGFALAQATNGVQLRFTSVEFSTAFLKMAATAAGIPWARPMLDRPVPIVNFLEIEVTGKNQNNIQSTWRYSCKSQAMWDCPSDATTAQWWWKDEITVNVKYKVFEFVVLKRDCKFSIPNIYWGITWDVNLALFCEAQGNTEVETLPANQASKPEPASTTPPSGQNNNPASAPSINLVSAQQAQQTGQFIVSAGGLTFTLSSCNSFAECYVWVANNTDNDISFCLDYDRTRFVDGDGTILNFYSASSGGIGGLDCKNNQKTLIYNQVRISMLVDFVALTFRAKAVQIFDLAVRFPPNTQTTVFRFKDFPMGP